jgi:hypothetical protein
MNGFTFITIATVVSCQVDKVIILTKSGFKVVQNRFFFRSWSLLPSSLKVLIDFLSACHFGI